MAAPSLYMLGSWALTLLVASVLPGCGGQKTDAIEWLGQTHAGQGAGQGGEKPGGAAALTRAQAEAALARALARDALAAALVYANRVVVTGGQLDSQRREHIASAIDALPRATLERAYGEFQAKFYPAALVAFRLALVTAHVGDLAAAEAWLDRADGAGGAAGVAVSAARKAALRRAIAARAEVDLAVIAVALPLTGPHAMIGAELEIAIRFAARAQRRAAPGNDRVALRFVDTRGEPDGAVAAVDKAIYTHRALAILGPVGAVESAAAARRAAEFGIPIALLSPAVSGASPSAGVFRLWSSPEWEASEAARVAIALGHDRPAILAPRDEHGALAAQAFTRAAKAAGIEVVASGSYDPTASDLEPDIKAFLGLDSAVNERLRLHLRRHGKKGWATFSPDVPFDLLYIPDEYHRAALVVAFLPYFNVEVRSRDVMDAIRLRRKHRGRIPQVVQLLGSSGWHREGLIPRGGQAIEGALVVDVFSGGENEEFASEDGAAFAQAYRDRTGRPATSLAAQAHDAVALVVAARRQVAARARDGKLADPRAAFRRALSSARLQSGACGPARVTASGEIEREAVLLRVDSGMFVVHEY